MNYACEAVIGAVSGLRTFTGAAVVAEAAHRKILKLGDTPVKWLGSTGAARASAALAIAEMIVDKLPFMPNRTDPPVLAARFVAGAFCSFALGRRRSGQDRAIAAAVGGSAAIAAAYAGLQYRKRVRLPAVVAAVLEDTVAVSAATAVVGAMCG